MPIYEFEDVKTGERHDIFQSIDNVTPIGKTIEWKGMTLRRLANFVLDTAGISRKTHKYPYVSQALPRKGPAGNLSNTQYNQQGQPIIRSQQHEREIAAATDMKKD